MEICLLKNLTDKVGRKYKKDDVEYWIKGRINFMGELGVGQHSKLIDLAKASHRIDNLHFRDNDLYGTLVVYTTPMGVILQSLIDAGMEIQTSMRAIGIVDKENNVQLEGIYAFDITAHYSNQLMIHGSGI